MIPFRTPMPRSATRPIGLLLAAALLASLVAACSSGGASAGGAPLGGTPAPGQDAALDSAGRNLVPPGFGTLRQEEIAIRVNLPSVQVRALPLDESVIRLLSPDSYRALRDLQEGRQNEIATMAGRHNLRRPSLWYLSFYGLQPESRFSPAEVVISSGGRDLRPLEIIPLTAGFGEQRLRQRETQSAIFVFDEAMNVGQPLVLSVEGVQNASWDATLRTIERERALIQSRASQGGAQNPARPPSER
ncbi:MAG: hypothetical protein WKG32_01465 [Gemmatimonadaceae bacterium]